MTSRDESCDRPVRVLYLISSLMMGGAERLMVDLFCHHAATKAHGLQLYYVVMNDLWDDALRAQLEQSGARGMFLNRSQGDKNPRYLRILLRVVREQNIDVVHAHTTGSKYWAMLLKAARPRLKLVYTVHSTFDVVRYRGARLWLHRRLVNHNIAISKAVLAQCQQKGLAATLIYNGANLAAIAHRPRAPFGRPPRLVCVSRLVPAVKGQDLILDALAEAKAQGRPFAVTLVGDIHGRYRAAYKQLQSKAQALGLGEDELRFAGLRADVPTLLAAYDGFLCASRKEGLGLSIIEAMAAGLVVISSNADGPAELVHQGQTGFLFENGDAKAIVAAVGKAFWETPPQQLEQMATAGQSFAQAFDIGPMYAAYVRLYRQVARPKSKAVNSSDNTEQDTP